MHRNRIDVPASRKLRIAVRACFAVLINGYLEGFRKGRIFTGRTKSVCVPVLNCYSCPGALGSCPIGALQNALGNTGGRFPFYVLGTLMLFGVILGRLSCGLLCPFGLIQDLLSLIPVRKRELPKKVDRALRYLKYAVLLVFVILLPAFLRDGFGGSLPWFCKYICPAGTLEGSIPLMLADPKLRGLAGLLFWWKLSVLVLVLCGAVFIKRFFCRYLCPLGAFYALFSRFSLVRMEVDKASCIGCGKCSSACPMSIDPVSQINGTECIMCGRCRDVCPASSISYDLPFSRSKKRRTDPGRGR